MVENIKGIILKHFNFKDNVKIITIYTEKYGKRNFLLYFSKSRKSLAKLKIIQPLYLVNINFRYKPKFNLQKISDITLYKPYETIPYSVKKTALAFLIAEILDKILIDQYQDKDLFDFIINSLELLDMSDKAVENFHLLFLTKLARFLGFMPQDNFSEQNKFFNIKEGIFVEIFQKGYTLNLLTSEQFHQLLNTDFGQMTELKLSREQRQNLLNGLLNFYGYHIENFLPIKSAKVLQTVFN